MTRRVPRWSLDLLGVVVCVCVGLLAVLSPGVPRPIRWVFGIALVVVLPGYALVSALLPGAVDTREVGPLGEDTERPDWIVRLALSLPLSVVVVGTVGTVLTWWAALRLLPAAAGVGLVTIAFATVGLYRRARRSPARRANPVLGAGLVSRGVLGTTPLQTTATAVALSALLLTTVYVGLAPPQSEGFSEVSVLTENENGTLVATGYPDTFVAGVGQPLSVAVENRERDQVSYTVVVLAQAVSSEGGVTDQQQIDRFAVRVPPGERTVLERRLAPSMVGDRIRVRFLVYERAVPDDPDVDTADHYVQFWTSVVESGPENESVP